MSYVETQQEVSFSAAIAIAIAIILSGIFVGTTLICFIIIYIYKGCKRCKSSIFQSSSRHHSKQRDFISTEQRMSDILRISDTLRLDETEYHALTTTMRRMSDVLGLNETEHHKKRLDDTEYHEPSISEHDNRDENHTTLQDDSLQSPAGPIVHQEIPDCFNEMCKNTETEIKCALQREDSLTYSHETQILLPTSGPPIDPYNTREFIPACFTPVDTLSQCTHDGRRYYDERNDFGLEIPAGAIPEGESITIDIGVALYGPFQYPEGLRPMSPVFWVCVRDQKDFQFLKPVKVTIPHCLNLGSHDDIESLGLIFLKGDHEMNPQQMYQFQQAEDVLIEPLKEYGVTQTTHFCSLCISGQFTEEFIKKARFCISAVFPPTIYGEDSAYFFITFFLKTCLNVVEKQIRKGTALQGHKREYHHFQFSGDGEEKALEIVLPQPLPEKWKIGWRFINKVCYIIGFVTF